ncbi:MAG TPA: hypothetical protein DDW27_09005 [Bacteroidales bacterium]|nr:hypothetical protein [Bacteroidales bacterium]
MKNYNLNIAGYKIRFENTSDRTDIIPSERFSKYISTENEYDFLIRVHTGKIIIPEGAKKVFDAPYIEEINNIRIKKSDDFWSVFQDRDDLFITSILPQSPDNSRATLKFSLKEKEWDLWIDTQYRTIDPMEYPLDGLILYYLTAINGDIMIHGSGVNHNGTGYLFSGISGRGKTTMAKFWDNFGAEIIHDDRLILRKTGTGYFMNNTPVYKNDEPRESPVSVIFLINHGEENTMIPVRGALAISMVMANCIQHNWNEDIVKGLLKSVSQICTTIPVYQLWFKPDESITEYLVKNE